MFEDFLAYLAAISYITGDAQTKKKKRKSARAQIPSEREEQLLRDFGKNFMSSISLALGRPYKHEFPQYLEQEWRRLGWDYKKISDERGKWLMRSKNGVMDYIAKKEGWTHRFRFVTKESPQELIEEQEEYASWHEEARANFPHYATDHVYIEDYPSKEAYFDGIREFCDEHGEADEAFGFVGESDDPEYDQEIRTLFYSIDPDNILGGIDMKYVVFKYVKQYEYFGKDWGNTKKLYTALTRIVREEGYDPQDLMIKDGFFSYSTRDDVVEAYRTNKINSQSIQRVIQIIENRKSEHRNPSEEDILEYKIHMEALRLMLRIDGHNPADFGL